MVTPRAIVVHLSSTLVGVAAWAAVMAGASPAWAQVAVEPQGEEARAERTSEEALRDFIHFVRIARYDAAEALGRSLVEAGMDPIQFVQLVEESGEFDRFERAVAEAMRVQELEPVAAALDRLFRSGKLAAARQPSEITRNIGLLSGGLRARSLARERLIAAGEYATPQLVEAFLQDPNPAVRAQVQTVLVDLGRQSIIPLCTALEGVEPARQEAIAGVLALIPYRTSLPYLTAVHQSTTSQGVRQATARAISALQGDPSASVADLFRLLADSFYSERTELTSFPEEEHQLLWHFDPGLGLRMTAIRSEVFHEAMAMRTAERALRLNPNDRATMALWIAANFSRELDTPEGYLNPVYGPDRRAAEYFAIAAGADTTLLVVQRGLETRDTPLVLQAIGAVQQTAGPRTLWGEGGGGSPMLASLTYPNRRVQYEAALALGMAQPRSTFSGSHRVVPLLAGAVRDAAARYAVVLTGRDREMYDRVRGVLEGEGYTVLPPAEGGLGEIAAAIAEAPGIDLIVTSLPLEQTLATAQEARADAAMGVSPMLAMLSAAELEPARRRFGRDQSVDLRRTGISDAQVVASVDALVQRASGGPILEDEASSLADRSLAVLRDLAVSNNAVLDVADAAVPLVGVLPEREGPVVLDIAEVLAHINQPRTQGAIMERALGSSDPDEQLAMLAKVADSGKRFGNLLEDRMVRRLVRLAGDENEALATQSAATMGALGVPYENLLPMILGEGDGTAAAILGER